MVLTVLWVVVEQSFPCPQLELNALEPVQIVHACEHHYLGARGRGVLTLPFPATASRSTLHAVARDFALRHGLTSSPPVESIVEGMAAAQLHWPPADLLAERALARRRWRVAHSDVPDDRLL